MSALEAAIAADDIAASAPTFWDDPQKAGRHLQLLTAKKERLAQYRELANATDELVELAEMIDPIADPALAKECAARITTAEADLHALELAAYLSGPHDHAAALLSIHAGTGGTDAMDWAQMLLRMFVRFAERHGYPTSLLDESPGEEAGIKSATLRIAAPYAYGRLKGEHGTHRLVRLSPFNAKNLRQTSFALVEVLPEITDDAEIDLPAGDLRIDVFRASGAGGQHVNKTSSAVRITHIPTGIQIASQTERSQAQNKAQALSLLRAKLARIQEEQARAEVAKLKGTYQKADFGAQIRSYVLQPYTLVKDLRTDVETAQVHDVLDGDLDAFLDAEIRLAAKTQPSLPT